MQKKKFFFETKKYKLHVISKYKKKINENQK